MSDNREQALSLARAPYVELTRRQQLSDGRAWYVAYNPELPGCMSDGPTPEAARQSLADARAAYIESLLDDAMPVTRPLATRAITTSTAVVPSVHRTVLTISQVAVSNAGDDGRVAAVVAIAAD